MLHRSTQQTTLGIRPIEDVNVSLKSRDELPPVITALKHIYITPELNEKTFAVLEEKIIANKKKSGRPGMDLWRILVLAVIRHALDIPTCREDRLEHISNNDRMVRQILGVHVTDWGVPEEEFAYQTIVDNVSLIDETMLEEINRIVAEYGHRLL